MGIALALSIAVLGMAYVGYPLAMWLLGRIAPRPLRTDGAAPSSVSVIVCARDESMVGGLCVRRSADAIELRLRLDPALESTEAELMDTVFPHPTVSEAMHESVLAAFGRPLHI